MKSKNRIFSAYYASVLFFITLFLIACGDIEPEPTPIEVPLIGEQKCTIDASLAPLWCCNTPKNSHSISVVRHSKESLKALESAYDVFESLCREYLVSYLHLPKYTQLSSEDKEEIIESTLSHLEEYYETWSSKLGIYYVLYKIRHKDLEEKLLESIEKHRYTRIYQGCFATGKIALKKVCKDKIKEFLHSTPLRQKRNIVIEVHTDKVGTDAKNLYISQKRAHTVAASLYYKEYKFSKVYYAGFGESNLLYDADTEKANRVNRRLVIMVKDKNAKIENQKYTRLYLSRTKNKKKSLSKRVKNQKSTIAKTKTIKKNRPSLVTYTGEADTGWIYFGRVDLKDKFLIDCTEDTPRKVKRRSLSNHRQEEFMTSVYKKIWRGKVGEYSIEIGPVSVFEDGRLPKKDPNILMQKGDDTKVLTTIVNSYRGKKGMLYRVFVNTKKSPKTTLKCMDLVLSYKTKKIEYGALYFQEKNSTKKRVFVAQP